MRKKRRRLIRLNKKGNVREYNRIPALGKREGRRDEGWDGKEGENNNAVKLQLTKITIFYIPSFINNFIHLHHK